MTQFNNQKSIGIRKGISGGEANGFNPQNDYILSKTDSRKITITIYAMDEKWKMQPLVSPAFSPHPLS